ncbi:MAG: hypothetical protein Ct9H300mP19_05620 [Dehalococcoidia bacterium]|nr:MAG: hypothetical protein Ct9H300mP19_05620 [Dehalococcoidia bacterium]
MADSESRGIAVGFGAQYLVRDLIAGIFILAENQYRTGDVVTVAGTSGLVESINLRRQYYGIWRGKKFVIPNGKIFPLPSIKQNTGPGLIWISGLLIKKMSTELWGFLTKLVKK